MWQRPQTVYLLAAIVLLVLLFVSPYGHREAVWVQDHPFTFLLTVIPALLSIVTIFFYKNRPLQLLFGKINLVLIAILLLIMVSELYPYGQGTWSSTHKNIGLGMLYPLLAIIFIYLAHQRIRKDEELVRAADRLRD